MGSTMTDVHRRVELQEQDDLRYLVNNVRRAANEKVDLALPPIEGEDALRKKVEELVDEYITRTFQTARPNLLINGHEPSEPLLTSILSSSSTTVSSSKSTDHEYEPLNTKLSTRLQDLLKQEEELLLEVTGLRRTAPGVVKEAWKEGFREGVEDDEKTMREAADAGDDAMMADQMVLGVTRMERQDDVETTWTSAVKSLESLKRDMGGTAARMERAKTVAKYVLDER